MKDNSTNRREFLTKLGLAGLALPLLSQTIFGNKSDKEILEAVKEIKNLCNQIADRFPKMTDEHRDLVLYTLMNLNDYDGKKRGAWWLSHWQSRSIDIIARKYDGRPYLTELTYEDRHKGVK